MNEQVKDLVSSFLEISIKVILPITLIVALLFWLAIKAGNDDKESRKDQHCYISNYVRTSNGMAIPMWTCYDKD